MGCNDLGKLMIIPGMTFNARKVNKSKLLGRTVDKRLEYVVKKCKDLQEMGFGKFDGENFNFFQDISHQIDIDNTLRNFIIEQHVQIQQFKSARLENAKFIATSRP